MNKLKGVLSKFGSILETIIHLLQKLQDNFTMNGIKFNWRKSKNLPKNIVNRYKILKNGKELPKVKPVKLTI